MGFLSGVTDIFKPSENHTGTDELFPDWMQQDVKDVASNISNLQTPEYFQGDTIAAQNPWMQQSLGDMAAWGQQGGLGNAMMNNMYGMGNQALDYGLGGGMDYMQGMQARGPNQFQYDQGTFDTTMGNLAPGVQNMFDANAGALQRDFDFNTLPGLKMQDAMGGGYGGTAGKNQSALADALNAGNIQQMGVGLWNNAANQAQAGAMQGGMSNLSSANNFDSNMLSNYGNYAQLGGNMLNDAYGMGQNNMAIGQTGANIQQGYDQSLIDADVARWNYEQQAPWIDQQQRQQLTQSWANPGAIQYGASPFQTGLDAATGLAGLYSGWPQGGGGGYNDYMLPEIVPQSQRR